jgi:hypothetical protein
MGDEILREIREPDPWLQRAKWKAQATDGRLERKEGCVHPMSAIHAVFDDRKMREVNIFVCGACGAPLWLVDPWGREASEDT